MQWVKSGLGERIQTSPRGKNLALKKTERASARGWPAAKPTPVPDTIQLKGLGGRPGRWVALINNETLRVGETGRVRVGLSNVLVRCVGASAGSVEIELLSSRERRVLRLAAVQTK